MKTAAVFTLLAAAATTSANVIPSYSGTAPPYPVTTIATINPGVAYPTGSTPTTSPGPVGTGVVAYPPVGTGGTGTGSYPANPTNGTYNQPSSTQGVPPTTEIPISGASRGGVGMLALAGAAAAYVLS